MASLNDFTGVNGVECRCFRSGFAEEITVSAAISLKNAFTDIGKIYEKSHPDVKVNFNFGASGDLIKQIQGGAPVAVFASAAPERHGYFGAGRGLLGFPAAAPTWRRMWWSWCSRRQATVKLAGFRGPGQARGEEDCHRQSQTSRPADTPWKCFNHFKLADGAFRIRLVLAENVRQVLDYVARGEVDAGLVYQTDAMTRAPGGAGGGRGAGRQP